MNKLGTLKQCPKCGTQQFTVTYIPPKTTERVGAKPYVLQDEYMWVECTRCGYATKELPLDAKEKADAKK